MPERKTLSEDLFYRGSSANMLRLHTCKNKVPFWDFSQFSVTLLFNTSIGLYQVRPFRARVNMGAITMKGTPYFSKLQYYWILTIRLFNSISRTLVGGVVLKPQPRKRAAKISLDFEIQTGHLISARRPD